MTDVTDDNLYAALQAAALADDHKLAFELATRDNATAMAAVGTVLPFVQHKANCDWLQAMWHKGPCDCGLTELLATLSPLLRIVLSGASGHVRETLREVEEKQRAQRAQRAMVYRSHYIQSSAADISTPKDAFKRFEQLDTELAAIGATVKRPVLMTHDDARIEIDCPQERQAEAEEILNRLFPAQGPR